MANVLSFVATHQVGIGIVGTLVVILGLITGYGRRFRSDDPR